MILVKHIAFELQNGNLDRVRGILACDPIPASDVQQKINQVLSKLPKQGEPSPEQKAMMEKLALEIYQPLSAVKNAKGVHPLQTQPDIVTKILTFLSPVRKDKSHCNAVHYSPLWGVAGVNALFSESASFAHMDLLKEKFASRQISYRELAAFTKTLDFPSVIALLAFFSKECRLVEKFNLEHCDLCENEVVFLAKYFPNVKEVICDVHGAFIRQYPRLERLVFPGPSFLWDNFLGTIAANCPNLEYISFGGAFATDDGIINLVKHVPKLKGLELRNGVNIRDEALNAIGTYCKELTCLSIEKSECTETGLTQLAENCPKLQHLNLNGSNNIMPQEMIAFFSDRFLGLTSINFGNCRWATNNVIKSLASSCRDLREVNFQYCPIRDDALIALSEHCTQLRQLEIRSCRNITDTGIMALAKSCVRLEKADLAGCLGLSSEVLHTLAEHCPKMRYIDLTDCQWVTREALIAFAKSSPFLEEIYIWRRYNQDEYFALARNCPRLKKISHCPSGIVMLALHVGCPYLDLEFMETYFSSKVDTICSYKAKSPLGKLLQALIRKEPAHIIRKLQSENKKFQESTPIELFIKIVAYLDSRKILEKANANISDIISLVDSLPTKRKVLE